MFSFLIIGVRTKTDCFSRNGKNVFALRTFIFFFFFIRTKNFWKRLFWIFYVIKIINNPCIYSKRLVVMFFFLNHQFIFEQYDWVKCTASQIRAGNKEAATMECPSSISLAGARACIVWYTSYVQYEILYSRRRRVMSFSRQTSCEKK